MKPYGLLRNAFWPNRCYENYGERWRVWIGDIAYWSEQESGYRCGPQLSFSIDVGDHIGDYDDSRRWPIIPVEDRKSYLTRSVSLQIWRWGFSINWRGSEIDEDWDIPRWKLDRDGELLKEWR